MTRVHDFIVDLAKGGKSFGDIKILVDDVYSDKAIKKTQIYEILKRVKMGKNTDDRRGFNKQKNQDDRRFNRLHRCRRRQPREHSGSSQGPWDIVWHHQPHPPQPAWACKEVGPLSPEAVVEEAEGGESENIEGVRQTCPDEGAVCSGSNYYYGQVICLHEHPQNKAAVETVAKKRHSRPCEGKGLCLQDEDHGAGVLRLLGDSVHELRPQGVHSQREIHHQSPGDLPKEFEEEEAGDREGGVSPLLGKRPSPHRECCEGVPREKKNIKLLSQTPLFT
jgi:hypothetical protein